MNFKQGGAHTLVVLQTSFKDGDCLLVFRLLLVQHLDLCLLLQHHRTQIFMQFTGVV
jgi:hypothetical protein